MLVIGENINASNRSVAEAIASSKRKLINRAFLLMASYAGLDAVILDPLDTKIMSLIKVADILTRKDPSCRSYLRAHRKGTLVD